MRTLGTRVAWLVVALAVCGAAPVASAAAPESKRLATAKDFIAEEQWTQAIRVLRAAVEDAKETRRDEALYWLAHSLSESGDSGAAVETIGRLERDHPKSLWIKPARALRLDIAMRLNRSDVLWYTAVPPAPPAPPVPHAPRAVPVPATPARPAEVAPPVPPAPPTPVAPPAPANPARLPRPAAVAPTPLPPPPPAMWLPEGYLPDMDLRVQALGRLIRTDAEKVIPILREIALESESPGPAVRAVFVLAQSERPEARQTVVQVAYSGSEPVRIAAVRELGRFGGPEISKELLQVYSTANMPVKWQVVKSLGERSEKMALLRIAESETNADLRHRAILTLGQAGGAEQLEKLYTRASLEAKHPILTGLFTARAAESLIRIAERERDQTLRREAITHLRMLGTPLAKEYLKKVSSDK